MTCYQEIICPKCGRNKMMKSGRNASDTQRYRCQAIDGETKTFMLTYRYKAYEPDVKEQINGSGLRDTARVLKISKNTVTDTFKKKASRICPSQP